jgi:hypothetical protein
MFTVYALTQPGITSLMGFKYKRKMINKTSMFLFVNFFYIKKR